MFLLMNEVRGFKLCNMYKLLTWSDDDFLEWFKHLRERLILGT